MGPSAAEESVILAEQSQTEALSAQPAAFSPDSEEASAAPLPPLEDLVKRIPPKTRAAMDELFRANFVTVKRVAVDQTKG